MAETTEHVIVISHRRSGTHLLIDAICNNFGAYKNGYVNLDRLAPGHLKKMSVDEFTQRIGRGPHVLKTHTYADWKRFFFQEREAGELAGGLFADSKLIYVYRDGRDVLASLYEYAKTVFPDMSEAGFSDFIKMDNEFEPLGAAESSMRVKYWAEHVGGWLERDDILLVSFEELVGKYGETLGSLSRFLNLPLEGELKNVVRTRQGDGGADTSLFGKVRERLFRLYSKFFLDKTITSTVFRKGAIGDYKGYFEAQDLELFDGVASVLMRRLGYYSDNSGNS